MGDEQGWIGALTSSRAGAWCSLWWIGCSMTSLAGTVHSFPSGGKGFTGPSRDCDSFPETSDSCVFGRGFPAFVTQLHSMMWCVLLRRTVRWVSSREEKESKQKGSKSSDPFGEWWILGFLVKYALDLGEIGMGGNSSVSRWFPLSRLKKNEATQSCGLREFVTQRNVDREKLDWGSYLLMQGACASKSCGFSLWQTSPCNFTSVTTRLSFSSMIYFLVSLFRGEDSQMGHRHYCN